MAKNPSANQNMNGLTFYRFILACGYTPATAPEWLALDWHDGIDPSDIRVGVENARMAQHAKDTNNGMVS